MGVVQEGVSEMMGEGWTRKRFRKERMMCKCRRGVVELIFLWFCSRVVVGSYNIRWLHQI